MERLTKLTPRTKDSQVAPEASSWSDNVPADPKPAAQSASVAPAPDDAKGPYSAEVERQVRFSGRAAAKESVLLYLKLLVPMTIVSLWMFTMYSVISWVVPNVLCSDVSKELSGSSLGISSCVYVSDGQYTPYSSAKVFWLFYWAVQTAWMAVFPGLVCKAIFGNAMSRLQIIITAAISAACFVTPFITALVFGMALDNYIVLLASTVGAFIVNIVCAPAAVRYTGDKLMRWRWIFLFIIAGQVNSFYLFVMPRLITLRSQQALGGMGLTVVRIFVHPAIWACVLFLFRIFQRHVGRVKDMTQVCFVVWPVLYSSLYGRFLLLQLSNVGSVVVMNFMFACFDIAGALADRGSDAWWLKLLYGSERAKDAMQSTYAVDEMELVDQLTGSMMEAASILSASALLTFGKVTTSPGVPPNNGLIWGNAAVQMITTLVFNYAELTVCGKFHNLEWRKVYPRSTLRFLGYVMAVLTIGGSRLCLDLLLLFCPRHYDEYGILLDECDKPSLFQAINFTFSRRAGGTALGQWLNLGPANNTAGVNM